NLEELLARIHSLFEKHRMEIEELIDPRIDKVTHSETVLEPRLIKHVTREMNEELFSRGKAIPGKLYYHEVKSSFKCVVKKGNKRAIRSLVRTK
ncbi:hypothetical protein Tco_1342275, partial [Tanacetum coccineum]